MLWYFNLANLESKICLSNIMGTQAFYVPENLQFLDILMYQAQDNKIQ